MASAITAIRHTDGRAGVLDGSPAREYSSNNKPVGRVGAGVGRIGQAVPSDPGSLESSWSHTEPQGSQEKVVLHQLWFRLSREDRARFGGCFCQMVLRAVGRRTGGAEGDKL